MPPAVLHHEGDGDSGYLLVGLLGVAVVAFVAVAWWRYTHPRKATFEEMRVARSKFEGGHGKLLLPPLHVELSGATAAAVKACRWSHVPREIEVTNTSGQCKYILEVAMDGSISGHGERPRQSDGPTEFHVLGMIKLETAQSGDVRWREVVDGSDEETEVRGWIVFEGPEVRVAAGFASSSGEKGVLQLKGTIQLYFFDEGAMEESTEETADTDMDVEAATGSAVTARGPFEGKPATSC
mmetsp:Transcript_41864/g.97485  ORF Transcript_41864/g.97485 Transcript_41864/m.97485 type:complete len:239 (-) Transcript_41864:13-729(-)